MGEQLIVWTARVFVACYVVRLWRELGGGERPADAGRLIWTFGLFVHLLHVAAAFHFLHGWSHQAALLHTAERTFATVGWRWGGGLYINYAFTAWWVVDVAWDWMAPGKRPLVYRVAFHSFFAFMFFNATIVFGPALWIPLGSAVILALALRYRWGLKRRSVAISES